jgi:hypothetical protein
MAPDTLLHQTLAADGNTFVVAVSSAPSDPSIS